MSAPDAKAWKLNQEEIDHLWRNEKPWCDEIGELTESVARRRALAELQALSELCELTQTLNGDSWMVDSAEIHNRIAAIEAEESTPPSASAQTAAP